MEYPTTFTFTILNVCYGGFRLSDQCLAALNHLREARSELLITPAENHMKYRNDPDLLHLLTTMGITWCSGPCSTLVPVPFPTSMKDFVRIDEYDGKETLTIDFNAAFTKQAFEILANHNATIDQLRTCQTEVIHAKQAYDEFRQANDNFLYTTIPSNWFGSGSA